MNHNTSGQLTRPTCLTLVMSLGDELQTNNQAT
jgi:hypothetical protein